MSRRVSQDFSSKRHFHWTKKVGNGEIEDASATEHANKEPKNDPKSKSFSASSSSSSSSLATPKKRLHSIAVTRLRSMIASLNRSRTVTQHALGPRVVGTLFGSRRGHVHFTLQRDPASPPAFLVELATPISGLVREMASGLVRIALECDKMRGDRGKDEEKLRKPPPRLIEESKSRTFCNGKKCGFATKKECGQKEMKVLKAVEMVTMGAGVLPEDETEAATSRGSGEVMYMRAKFERIVGSRDSEAFYMMNPDSNGAPELSVYLLRI